MRTAKPIQSACVLLLAAALAACGGRQQPEQDNSPAVEAPAPAGNAATARATADGAAITPVADAPPPAFAQCQSCHSPEAGKNGIGPSLAGVFGTRAAEVPGYDFTPAMKQAGLVWDEATLDRYLKAPQEVVPGTRMLFPGIKDDAKRAAVIAYLKTIG